MEKHQPAISRQATLEVFDKYGGVQGWFDACSEFKPTSRETKEYQTICSAILMTASSESLLLDSELEANYEAINYGLMFGIYVLSLNFMNQQNKVEESHLLKVISFQANQCRKYIDTQLAEKLAEGDVEANEQQYNDLAESNITGYRELVETSIDVLCPNIELQYRFRAGTQVAETIMNLALELAESDKKFRTNQEFANLTADLELDFEI